MPLSKTRRSRWSRHLLNVTIFACLIGMSISGVEAAEQLPVAHTPAQDYSQPQAHLRDQLSAAEQRNNEDFYRVELLGAVYLFNDAKTYRRFLADGHVGERRFLGAEDDGRTVVVVVSEQDQGIQSKTAAEQIYHGELAGADNFYAEVRMDNRLRRFNNWAAFKRFQKAL